MGVLAHSGSASEHRVAAPVGGEGGLVLSGCPKDIDRRAEGLWALPVHAGWVGYGLASTAEPWTTLSRRRCGRSSLIVPPLTVLVPQ